MPWDFWLIFVLLGVVIPWRGHVLLNKLLALPSVDTNEKLGLYATTIGFQWVLAGLVAWRAITRGLLISDMGLASGGWFQVTSGVLGGIAIGAFQWLNLRRIGKMEGDAPALLRKLAKRFLPVNLVEFLAYSPLAITAGVCEEFLYRGFALAALAKCAMPIWLTVVLTSILFGLAHAYQGRAGILSTALFGVVLAIARLVMIWHAGLDLAAGIAAPRYLLRDREPRDQRSMK